MDTLWTRPGENRGNSGNTAWHYMDVFRQVSGMFWHWATCRATGFGRSTTSTWRTTRRPPDLRKRIRDIGVDDEPVRVEESELSQGTGQCSAAGGQTIAWLIPEAVDATASGPRQPAIIRS